MNWGGDGHCWGHGSISPQGCEEEAGVWKPFSISRLWSIVIYPCAHRHWIWRRDGRSETVFVGSAKRHARRLSAAMTAFLTRREQRIKLSIFFQQLDVLQYRQEQSEKCCFSTDMKALKRTINNDILACKTHYSMRLRLLSM